MNGKDTIVDNDPKGRRQRVLFLKGLTGYILLGTLLLHINKVIVIAVRRSSNRSYAVTMEIR